MRRRDLLAALAAAASLAPRQTFAQAQPKMLRVGIASLPLITAPFYDAFRKKMAGLGYVEGKNFVWEFVQVKSFADYQSGFAEVARRKVDIFMALGNEPSLRAARAAAGGLPIVIAATDYDPIQKGYVASLARPGGNITGLFVRQIELAAKRVELAREALPNARILRIWWDAASHDQAEAAAASARTLGFEPREIEVDNHSLDYEGAAGRMAEAPGEPVLLGASAPFLRDHAAIMSLLAVLRIPVIAPFREFCDSGALLSYGIDLPAIIAATAGYIDHIAKGAKPGDLPIEQPTHFDMAVNLKTAESLGIVFPASLTARADEVIE